VNYFLARPLIQSACFILALGAFILAPQFQADLRAAPPGERVVYLARDLSDEDLIGLGAALAAWREDSVLLLDSAKASPYVKAFLAAYKPTRIIPVEIDPLTVSELEGRLDIKTAPPLFWNHGPPITLWRSLFSRAEDVVVCPAHPRGCLLQAACLAGALRAPLYVVHGRADEGRKLNTLLGEWHAQRVHLIGKAGGMAERLDDVEHVYHKSESAVAAAYQKQLSRQGHIENVVLANPADTAQELGGMSALAPWIALRKRAALLLTNPQGTNVSEIADRALRREALRHVEALLLVANLRAIPMWHRPNPIPGDKDPHIEMEPLTPSGNRPFTFATGRLFHEDRAVVPLLLARQRLLSDDAGPRKALVVSNPGGSLSLLETFSRNTIQEMRNAGYQTTTLIGNKVNRDELRKQLALHDLFLWEGHHNTLINEYEFPSWDEPLPPTFVFLQSCLALTEKKVHPLLGRGAVGVIGSSTRTYSASGGACSLAFFNALLYEQQSVGAALRQSKNFLLAYSLLKQKRLGKDAMRTGANVRAAWAFTLWGDPTLKLPPPQQSATDPQSLPSIQHEVQGNTIRVTLPGQAQNPVQTDKYQVSLPPNGRLAGLVRKERVEDRRPLVPFVFAEIHLPKARSGWTPRLSSRLPSNRWVFCWDERRRCGYLLATPRAGDTGELRFHVIWEAIEANNNTVPTVGSGQ
jgi:hypothetical protein